MTFKILDPNFVLWLWNRIKTMVKNYVTTYVSNNALASTTKYAASKDVGGAAELTVGIPFGKLDETSTSTVMTATVPGITELKSGVCMFLMNGRVTSASGYTININGLGAKPVYGTMAAATRSTTLFNVAYTGFFVFNEERVEGGCWDFYYGYNSDTNTVGYVIRTNYQSLPMTDKLYRYRLVFTSADGTHFVPADTSTSTNATSKRDVNQTPINPFGEIALYNYTTVINAEARPEVTYLYQQYPTAFGYSFNRTGAALTMTAWKPVYVKASPQSDGSAIIDADEPYVQDLPTSEDGYIYIFLGVAYSATYIELMIYHPVYYFKDGAIRLWTNQPAIQTVHVSPSGTTALTCETGKYHRVEGVVNTLAVTLPAISNLSNVYNISLSFTTGTSPVITFSSADSRAIRFQSGYDLAANTTYEVNCLFNGFAWMIALVAFENQ